jgi:hypothetical protein
VCSTSTPIPFFICDSILSTDTLNLLAMSLIDSLSDLPPLSVFASSTLACNAAKYLSTLPLVQPTFELSSFL